MIFPDTSCCALWHTPTVFNQAMLDFLPESTPAVAASDLWLSEGHAVRPLDVANALPKLAGLNGT
jgi:hypothetical protein